MTLTLRLFGTFQVNDDTETDRRPKLMKAKAILAVLAATPGHRRSRSWLQSLLWSDRQPAQAMSSLRTALADVRRHFGPHADILLSDHSEIALDVARVQTDLEQAGGQGRQLLEGFDIPHAPEFEDWLRELRQSHSTDATPTAPVQNGSVSQGIAAIDRLYLGSMLSSGQSMTQMQADALVDNLAKATEDLGLAETVDGRGAQTTQENVLKNAQTVGCSLILMSEAAETATGSMIRLKVLETATRRLIWSKSLTSPALIQLDDPATIAAVAELIDILAEQKMRLFDWQTDHLPPAVIGMAGVRHMFRLGAQNYETAEKLLKLAYERDPRAIYLAWRAYLRTFFIGEIEFGCKETVIEEGTFLSRRALEKEPHNSMVLAACAHVENMLHNSHQSAYDLASRALGINQCNPLAWSTLGVASAFLGDSVSGKKFTKIGAKLSEQSWHSAQLEILAGSASLVDGDIKSAQHHSERSHLRSSSYAPPLRFLSAIYFANGDYDGASEMSDKLRVLEPDFKLEQLKDDGYPAESLRKANLLNSLPSRET